MAVVLGQYHTTPPTLPDKGQEPLQMDTRGNLKVTVVGLNGAAASASLTASAPTSASVGVTSAQAVALNASRTGLVLVNTSSNWISLAVGAAAVLYSGISLAPNGGTWTMDAATFTTGQIRAIASGATSNLAIQEFA